MAGNVKEMKKAAANSSSRIKLNLLHTQGVKEKLPFLFLKWLVAYGRFIVIAVEIIVVATFVARFKYDADIEDYKDKIAARLPYLESLSVDEAAIRKTQFELDQVKKVYSNSPDWQSFLNTLSAKTPKNVSLRTISLERPAENSSMNFRLTAAANSNDSLAVLIKELKNQSGFSDINLSSINFEDGEIKFSITGTVAKEKI